MSLRNPPVIEAWVEFHFVPRENEPEWNQERAKDFFATALDGAFSFKHYRMIINVQRPKEVNQLQVTVRPRFDLARGFREGEDRALQAGRTLLVYNMLKRQDRQWPGYEVLRDEAFLALEAYRQFAKPQKIRRITLNYRDIICIPEQKFRLENYFRIMPLLSCEPLGTLGRFAMDLLFPEVSRGVALRLMIRSIEVPEEQAESRFQFDWQASSEQPRSMEDQAITSWLDQAHKIIEESFRKAFTEQGWALFE